MVLGISLFIHISFFASICYIANLRRVTIFNPLFIYLIFHFIVFVVRPILIYTLGFGKFSYIGYYPSESIFVEALFVTDFFLLIFSLPFLFNNSERRDNSLVRFNGGGKTSLYIVTVLICSPLIVMSIQAHSIAVQVQAANGLFIQESVSGYIWDAKNMLFGILVLSFIVFRNSFIYILLFMFIAFNLYLSSGRWLIVIAIGFVLYHRVLFLNLKINFFKMVPIILVSLYFFLLLSGDREFFTALFERRTEGGVDFSIEKIDTLDFANFDTLTFLIHTIPNETEFYRYGTQYLSLFISWIPRFIWVDKPIGDAFVFYDLNNHGNFVALTYSIVGDAWSSGGYLGLLITALVFSFILKKLYTSFSSSTSFTFKLFYISFLPLLIILFRDGGVSIFRLSIMTYLPFAIYFILNFVFKPFSREKRCE